MQMRVSALEARLWVCVCVWVRPLGFTRAQQRTQECRIFPVTPPLLSLSFPFPPSPPPPRTDGGGYLPSLFSPPFSSSHLSGAESDSCVSNRLSKLIDNFTFLRGG